MREYTGLRYVPIFEGEFTPNRAYENLSIVQYQGEIYMSKQPTNGEAITNAEYWVKMPWNDYTAQINEVTNKLNQYKSQNDNAVAALQTELDDLGLQVQDNKPTAPQFQVDTGTPEIMNYIPHTVNDEDYISIYELYETYSAIFARFSFLRQVFWLSPSGEKTFVYDVNNDNTNDGEVLPDIVTVFQSNGTYTGGTFLLIFCTSPTDTLNDANTIVYPAPQLGSSGAGRDGGEPQFYTKTTTTTNKTRYYNSMAVSTGGTHVNYFYNLKTYVDQMAQRHNINVSGIALSLLVNRNTVTSTRIQYNNITDTSYQWQYAASPGSSDSLGLLITIHDNNTSIDYMFMYPVH